MVICIFGDSITWGAFLPFRGAWANLLRNYLESLNKRITLYDLGVDKDTSQDVLDRFIPEAKARKPDLLIFAVGINDSAYRFSKDNPVVNLEEFKKNLLELIERGRKFTQKIIFVGLAKGDDSNTQPLPRSRTKKSYDKANTWLYNEAIRTICKKEQLRFVNIIDLLKNEDFDDGLHPNLGGHQKIFEEVRRELQKMRLDGNYLNLKVG